MLKGNHPRSKVVYVIEKVRCCAHGEEGVAIRVSGSFIVGNELLVCEDGLRAEGMPSTDEGMPSTDEVPLDIMSKRVGRFREEFFMEQGNAMGCFIISTQTLHVEIWSFTSQVSTLELQSSSLYGIVAYCWMPRSLFLIL